MHSINVNKWKRAKLLMPFRKSMEFTVSSTKVKRMNMAMILNGRSKYFLNRKTIPLGSRME
jgi:hypothetical protein